MGIELPSLNFGALLPVIIVILTSVMVLIFDLALSDKRPLGWISFVGLMFAGGAGWIQQSMEGFDPAFQNMAITDGYTHFFNLIFVVGAGLSVLVALGYLGKKGLQGGEYYAMLLLATSGMMIMAAGTDLMIIFLGLELMSISLYVLAAINRYSRASLEAGIKYFLLGAFASAFFLYGIALIYGASGSTNLNGIGEGLKAVPKGYEALPLFGLGLLIIGFSFKIAAVPFHWWTPDVYHGAPTSVTAFMSVGAKAAGFAALIRVLTVSFGFDGSMFADNWHVAVATLAVLTMTLGNLTALAQNDVKRMLAYSSIAHAGYVLVGVVTGTEQGISAALFYLMAYAFMNIGAFAVISVLEQQDAIGTNLEEYAGLAGHHRVLAMLMAIFMLSLMGFPMLGGFWGKVYVFLAAIEAGWIVLAIIAVLNSGIAAYYYLRVIVHMYMSPVSDQSHAINLNSAMQVALGLAAFGTILLGVMPARIMDLAASSGLFG
ncbi:MAG: hypothetical protein B6242_07090 [Anaerolineaceae bacterium 4572_78]|nr:MAG: hypothetical protein B6242_07090 [Anaerolineaceae bacterium 4572_78]